jgi:hypothetical protein
MQVSYHVEFALVDHRVAPCPACNPTERGGIV